MVIVKISETNIYRNLAIEESIFESESLIPPALFLWQSDSAVVIGKHQNPWKECLVEELKADSIPLARRISGGGTVYHDIGNLNYAVISDQNDYDANRIYKMIFNTLKTFGLNAQLGNKSNLCINGKKFSGNAFAFQKKRALHHGTLLVNTDLDKLRYYLKPQYEGIETKAIVSQPASVVNLYDLNKRITVKRLSKAIEKSFSEMFAGKDSLMNWSENDIDNYKISEIEKQLRSDAWIFGKTPDFTVTINGRELQIKNGKF